MPYPLPPPNQRPDTHLNPDRAYLLELAGIQQDFVRGEGSWLYDKNGVRYLDLIAQYGAVPFGYNPPELWEVIDRCHREMLPMMVQPAAAPAARELAARLCARAGGGLQYVTFCCTGAETVETAIKLARAHTGRPGIVSLDGSFHGKTLAALSATGRDYFQTPFFVPLPDFHRVPFGDLAALEALLSTRGSEIAAFIVEVVQGEGGMRVLPPGYLKEAARLCRQRGVLLVADEVQTGLGRTGALFACHDEEVEPDILLVAKALGGGIVPIGACLCTAKVWSQNFGMLHSSTFANNALSCSVGLAVLERVADPAFLAEVRRKSQRLRSGLDRLQARYPDVVSHVSGRGLMLGIALGSASYTGDDSMILSVLSKDGTLSPFLCGHLINVWNLWVAPLVSQDNMLRIEPSLTIADAEIDTALAGLEGTFSNLQRQDTSALVGHLVGREQQPDPAQVFVPAPRRHPDPPVITAGERLKRFAFFAHYTSLQDLRRSEPSFAGWSDEDLNAWLKRGESFARPRVAYHLPLLRTPAGAAEGWLIVLGLLPDQLLALGQRRASALLQEGVDIARSLDVDMLGLGAFTSVVTAGGQTLAGKGVPITTGNTYTVSLAIDGVTHACRSMGVSLPEAHACVVGAAGSIGRLASVVLAERAGRLTLVGNPANADRVVQMRRVAGQILRRALLPHSEGVGVTLRADLEPWIGVDAGERSGADAGAATHAGRLREALAAAGEDANVALTEAVEALYVLLGKSSPVRYAFDPAAVVPSCEVVLCATSSAEAVVPVRALRSGAVVCDVALPPDVSVAAWKRRPDVLTFEGGLARYPDPHLSLAFNFGYPPGLGPGCLAETMILALQGERRDRSIGRTLADGELESIRAAASTHGFTFGGLRRDGQELGEADVERVRAARDERAAGTAAAPHPSSRPAAVRLAQEST